ncbi:hypothetical protein RRG08_000390, partial [Elysia crispata]
FVCEDHQQVEGDEMYDKVPESEYVLHSRSVQKRKPETHYHASECEAKTQVPSERLKKEEMDYESTEIESAFSEVNEKEEMEFKDEGIGFVVWSMLEKRLVCDHPYLGRLGELKQMRIQQNVQDWVERNYSCQVFYADEIYTSCLDPCKAQRSDTSVPRKKSHLHFPAMCTGPFVYSGNTPEVVLFFLLMPLMSS